MAAEQKRLALRQIDRLFRGGSVTGLDEGRMLERFLADRDESILEALIDRHGPMVLGVCRRVLANPADVGDAFQATFLVLARKASEIVRRESLAGWLYEVAYHAALRTRTNAGATVSRPPLGNGRKCSAS